MSPPSVPEVLRSSGQSLDAATRALMEPRFRHDFSRVRVHVDSGAAASAQEIDALAYTVGRDIVFASGRFAPHTASGQRLLAHELAHTIQQGEARQPATAGDLRLGPQHDPFEAEAERVSTSLLAARTGEAHERLAGVSLHSDGTPTLRRQPRPDAGTPEDQPLQTLPRKEEGGGKIPPPSEPVCKPPSDIKLPCLPQGLSDVEFLKKGAPQEAFGITRTLSEDPTVPEVLTKLAGKTGQVVIQKTSAMPTPCESFFTRATKEATKDKNAESISRTIPLNANDPKESANAEKCGGSYRREFRITPEGEKKISEMEMEHCRDFKHAFDISLGCYASVVNSLARKKTEFPSQEDAVDAVSKTVGRTPDTWKARYLELLRMTAIRDTKKWHTAVEPKGPGLQLEVDRRGHCSSRFPTEINEASYPEVGQDKHSTDDIIK